MFGMLQQQQLEHCVVQLQILFYVETGHFHLKKKN